MLWSYSGWRDEDYTTQDTLSPNDHDMVASRPSSDTCRVPCFAARRVGILLLLSSCGTVMRKPSYGFYFYSKKYPKLKYIRNVHFYEMLFPFFWNICRIFFWRVLFRKSHSCSLRLGMSPECTFRWINSCSGKEKYSDLKWTKFLRRYAFKNGQRKCHCIMKRHRHLTFMEHLLTGHCVHFQTLMPRSVKTNWSPDQHIFNTRNLPGFYQDFLSWPLFRQAHHSF